MDLTCWFLCMSPTFMWKKCMVHKVWNISSNYETFGCSGEKEVTLLSFLSFSFDVDNYSLQTSALTWGKTTTSLSISSGPSNHLYSIFINAVQKKTKKDNDLTTLVQMWQHSSLQSKPLKWGSSLTSPH